MPKYLSKNAKNLLSKMLNSDPKKRPTMEQLKQDAFFAGLDWKLLELKKVAPPTVLKKPPPKEEQK